MRWRFCCNCCNCDWKSANTPDPIRPRAFVEALDAGPLAESLFEENPTGHRLDLQSRGPGSGAVEFRTNLEPERRSHPRRTTSLAFGGRPAKKRGAVVAGGTVAD